MPPLESVRSSFPAGRRVMSAHLRHPGDTPSPPTSECFGPEAAERAPHTLSVRWCNLKNEMSSATSTASTSRTRTSTGPISNAELSAKVRTPRHRAEPCAHTRCLDERAERLLAACGCVRRELSGDGLGRAPHQATNPHRKVVSEPRPGLDDQGETPVIRERKRATRGLAPTRTAVRSSRVTRSESTPLSAAAAAGAAWRSKRWSNTRSTSSIRCMVEAITE